jgi:hypothetical protein
MASLVLTSAQITYGTVWSGTAPGPGNPTPSGVIVSTASTDFSDHIRQVTLNMNVAMQDFTTFGDGAFISQKPGLKGADISVEFNQDFAASSVDATFYSSFINGTLGYLDLKPTNSARGSANPSYVYACYVSAYPPIGQSVGDRAAVTVGLAVSGTYARLTS